MEVDSCDNMKAIVGKGNEDQVMEFSQLSALQLRHLPHMRGISRRSGTVSFPNLTNLEICDCESLKYVFTTSMVKSLMQLKSLQISFCNSMEEIIHVTEFEEDGIDMIVFPQLDFLELDYLPSLKRFISGYPISFLKLRELHITTASSLICEINESSDEYLSNDVVIPNVELLELDRHSLKAITQSDEKGFLVMSLRKLKEVTLRELEEESIPFLFDLLRQIYSLEKLRFYEGSLGEIFSLDDERKIGDHLGPKHLHLDGVSKLEHIVKEDSQLNPISQCFQTLRVSRCEEMINIAPSSVSFINLTTLHVFRCDKMASLVTSSTAKSLIQLTELEVQTCEMMENIIVANDNGDHTEEHDDNDVITFSKLKRLELVRLPKLNSFCCGNYNINFPLLEQVSIRECSQMKIFCGGVVSTPKLQGEGNVNAIIARQIQESRLVNMLEDGDYSPKMLKPASRFVDMSEYGDDSSEMLIQENRPVHMPEEGDHSSEM